MCEPPRTYLTRGIRLFLARSACINGLCSLRVQVREVREVGKRRSMGNRFDRTRNRKSIRITSGIFIIIWRRFWCSGFDAVIWEHAKWWKCFAKDAEAPERKQLQLRTRRLLFIEIVSTTIHIQVCIIVHISCVWKCELLKSSFYTVCRFSPVERRDAIRNPNSDTIAKNDTIWNAFLSFDIRFSEKHWLFWHATWILGYLRPASFFDIDICFIPNQYYFYRFHSVRVSIFSQLDVDQSINIARFRSFHGLWLI